MKFLSNIINKMIDRKESEEICNAKNEISYLEGQVEHHKNEYLELNKHMYGIIDNHKEAIKYLKDDIWHYRQQNIERLKHAGNILEKEYKDECDRKIENFKEYLKREILIFEARRDVDRERICKLESERKGLHELACGNHWKGFDLEFIRIKKGYDERCDELYAEITELQRKLKNKNPQ